MYFAKKSTIALEKICKSMEIFQKTKDFTPTISKDLVDMMWASLLGNLNETQNT
jgi:hypothetical protein